MKPDTIATIREALEYVKLHTFALMPITFTREDVEARTARIDQALIELEQGAGATLPDGVKKAIERMASDYAHTVVFSVPGGTAEKTLDTVRDWLATHDLTTQAEPQDGAQWTPVPDGDVLPDLFGNDFQVSKNGSELTMARGGTVIWADLPDHIRLCERLTPASPAPEGVTQPDDAREKLAEYAHEAWSGWMKYLFSKGDRSGRFKVGSEGEIDIVWTMPAWAVERWTRQMNTPYQDLSEAEKTSDRDEADKMLAIVTQRPPASQG